MILKNGVKTVNSDW